MLTEKESKLKKKKKIVHFLGNYITVANSSVSLLLWRMTGAMS